MLRIAFVLIAFFSADPSRGGTACGLSPGLIDTAALCARGGLDEAACAWSPVLADLAADRPVKAYEKIERDFGLPRHRAQGLLAPLHLLMPLLVDCPPVQVAEKVIDPAANALLASSREAMYLVERLFPSDGEALSRLERLDVDPSLFARVERAVDGLVALLGAADLRPAMAALTRDGAYLRPGARPHFDRRSGGVASYSALLEEIDALILQGDRGSPADFRRRVRYLASQPGPPEGPAIVHARLGSALLFQGRLEGALLHLLQAEDALHDLSGASAARARWKALRQISQLLQIQVYLALQLPASARLVEERIREDGPVPALESMLEASKKSPGHVSEILAHAAVAVRGNAFLEVQPVMEAIELISPKEPGRIDPSAARSMEALQSVSALVRAGRLTDALGELERAIDRSPSFLLGGPAGLIAHAALERGDQATALRAIELAVRLMEQEAGWQRIGEVQRSFMGGSGAGPFIAAVFLAERMGDARLAFDYAERGRAYATRQALGSTVRQHAFPIAPSELEIEAELVRSIRGGGEKERWSALRRELELRRLERQLRLLDSLPLGGVEISPSLDEVRELLEADEIMLAFFLGGEKLITWKIERGGFEWTTRRWSRSDFECRLSELRWRRTPPAVREAARSRGGVLAGEPAECRPQGPWAEPSVLLFDQVLGDLLPDAAPGRRLILVPHGPLHRLPWSALRRSLKGRYLAEDFELTTLPSAAAFVARRSSTERPRPVLVPSPARPESQEKDDSNQKTP